MSFTLVLESDGRVLNGENNYWSTTTQSEIEAQIWDNNDNLDLAAAIVFSPFLPSADVSTPTL